MPERQSARVVLVDDEPDLLESCLRILEDERISCVGSTDPTEALRMIRAMRPEVVVTDFKMPGMNGVELMAVIKGEFPEMPVIMISAYATIEGVVEAVKSGAFDYVTKPFSPDQLVITVRRALEKNKLVKENDMLRQKVREDFLRNNFVGRSRAMAQITQIITKVASSRTCVMIQGETGSGKRTAAMAIHVHGGRDGAPFVAVDCAELTKDQLLAPPAAPRAEGAGPEDDTRNFFLAAEGGTLYLDGVDRLVPHTQAKLATVLQNKGADLSGRRESAPLNARVICSTDVDLKGMVNEGRFRQDLYFLLNVVNIHIPPLRERPEDIPPLCESFLMAMARRDGGEPTTAGNDFLRILAEYHWPGNVRELMGALETAVAGASSNELTSADLPDNIRRQGAMRGMTYKKARETCLGKFERDFLENLLYTCKGNITQASETAGIARMSLYRMIKRNSLVDMVSHEREAEKAKGAGGSGMDENDETDSDEGNHDSKEP
ncbi:MAG: sigma-54 dependent transcriptional regulator [Nitrospinota bacterium]|nr:sigma-54 dependent transcriptional regulator [Nitrospinota bacterium]